MTSLYDNIIFGPVRSRRLGLSLGVNLLPIESKLCSFDCIYCECGWNDEHPGKRRFNSRDDVRTMLDETLEKMVAAGTPPDVITFAGNGEPTLHPEFEKIIAAIKAIRNTRSGMNVPPSVKAKLFVETKDAQTFEAGKMFFERLASASEVEIAESFDIPDSVTVVTDVARIFIPLSDIVDTEKELARLDKEKKAVQKDLDFLNGKLNNQGFLAKAPEKLIEAEKAKLAKAEEKMAKIMQSIEALKK